jgi:hypothetical protein
VKRDETQLSETGDVFKGMDSRPEADNDVTATVMVNGKVITAIINAIKRLWR